MRPVRRGTSPRDDDFDDFGNAFPFLVSRLGSYCSYCERKIMTNLAVEHIQPKSLPKYAKLIGCWENFLLACVNCNSTKGKKDVDLTQVLLPDRDNTFLAFKYSADGSVRPAEGLPASVKQMAANVLSLTGLDKRPSQVFDENGKMVAIERMSQRMEAWLLADEAKSDVDANPGNDAVRRGAVRAARESGFFSIWMTVFGDDIDIRRRLIEAFNGTGSSACFDEITTLPLSPAPNPDGLPHGGKT